MLSAGEPCIYQQAFCIALTYKGELNALGTMEGRQEAGISYFRRQKKTTHPPFVNGSTEDRVQNFEDLSLHNSVNI